MEEAYHDDAWVTKLLCKYPFANKVMYSVTKQKIQLHLGYNLTWSVEKEIKKTKCPQGNMLDIITI